MFSFLVTTVPTACGIETVKRHLKFPPVTNVATVPTACGIETNRDSKYPNNVLGLQQYLPLAVCDEGCEAAEERSDDEVRTSLVPDRREGQTIE